VSARRPLVRLLAGDALFALVLIALGLAFGTFTGVSAAGPPPLYPRHDPWRAWLADEKSCPGGEDERAPAARQVQTLFCLVNYARRRQHLHRVSLSPVLSRAAAMKAADIDRCGEFAHAACGKSPDHNARALGYRGSFGENLYAAQGRFAAPRVALDQWLDSRGHRRNILRPQWRKIGIVRRPDVDLERFRDAVVWVNEFGE